MAENLDDCCRRALENMQGCAELGVALKVFLAASPFILILPDMLPPSSSKEAIETLGEKVVQMSGEKVLSNVVDTSALPDFADSVRNVNDIAVNRMHHFAQIHSLRHAGGNTEGKLWAKLREIYDPDGEIRTGGGGWDLNPFW
jgi:hypothetical protein